MEVCLNVTGKCRRCDADEVLATVAGVRSEPTQMQECEVFKWRRGYKRSSRETVISTIMSHKAKRDKAQPRNVTSECADAMRVSEHYASTPPRVGRWETSDCRWKQDRDIDESSETCRVAVNEAARYVKDTAEQVIPMTAEVPDAVENLNNEFERVKESEEQFLGFHDVLEPLTQKVAIPRDEGRLAEEAVLKAKSACENPEWLLLELTTLECAKKNPSDLGTRIPESEARSDRVSRLGSVTVTSRFAVLWMTRAKWNCLGDTCELTRAGSASDEVIVSGYWFKRWNGASDWNGGNDWINLHINDECRSRRSSRRNDAGLAWDHEQIQRVESAIAAQRRGAVEHPRSEERKKCASGRLACAQCAQVVETERVSQQEYSTSTCHVQKLV